MTSKPPLRCALFGHKYVEHQHYAECSRVSLFRRQSCKMRLLKKVRLHSVSLVPNAPGTLSFGFDAAESSRLEP